VTFSTHVCHRNWGLKRGVLAVHRPFLQCIPRLQQINRLIMKMTAEFFLIIFVDYFKHE